ncbi:hypothetical protein [Salipaludibacillus daqingensis]|uniref:hypothetical protein n=1 Tax=Salipaludibacillus daqingensis TaxID=3041001 RepID=UPI002476C8AE|nr:hypothetical protein [Salipaludibacillus daqingensis]
MEKKTWTRIQIVIGAILIPGMLLFLWVTDGDLNHILMRNPIYRWSSVLIVLSGFYVAILAEISKSTGKTDKKHTYNHSSLSYLSLLWERL